tara:strand:+ start:96 stop:386 length:291 start_codon:yes stop_codon:yes gene_type:complete
MSTPKSTYQENVITKLTGPVSALVLCIFGISYLANWIDKASNRHFESIDTMVEQDKIERRDSLEQQKKQTENIVELTDNVKELAVQMEKMKDCCNK